MCKGVKMERQNQKLKNKYSQFIKYKKHHKTSISPHFLLFLVFMAINIICILIIIVPQRYNFITALVIFRY